MKGWYGEKQRHAMASKGIQSNTEIRSFETTTGSEAVFYGNVGEYGVKSEEIADESKPAFRRIMMLNKDICDSFIRFFIHLNGKEKAMLHYDIIFDDIRYFIKEINKTNPISGELLLKHFNEKQKKVHYFIKNYKER